MVALRPRRRLRRQHGRGRREAGRARGARARRRGDGRRRRRGERGGDRGGGAGGRQHARRRDRGRHRHGPRRRRHARGGRGARRGRSPSSASCGCIGVTGYEGHCSLTPSASLRRERQHAAMGFLVEAAEAIRAAGLPAPIVSAGGTATWDWTAAYPGRDRDPGRLVRGDGQLPRRHGRRLRAVAVTVLATVISRRPDRVIVDAGQQVDRSARAGVDRGARPGRAQVRRGARHLRRHAGRPRCPSATSSSSLPGYARGDGQLVRRVPRRRGRPGGGHLARDPARSRPRRSAPISVRVGRSGGLRPGIDWSTI